MKHVSFNIGGILRICLNEEVLSGSRPFLCNITITNIILPSLSSTTRALGSCELPLTWALSAQPSPEEGRPSIMILSSRVTWRIRGENP
ncbi:hypothetical protein RB213_001550, partial [Colletotrichum asianum]